jgi:hypothetical protein
MMSRPRVNIECRRDGSEVGTHVGGDDSAVLAGRAWSTRAWFPWRDVPG